MFLRSMNGKKVGNCPREFDGLENRVAAAGFDGVPAGAIAGRAEATIPYRFSVCKGSGPAASVRAAGVLGPAGPPPVADLGSGAIGTQPVGEGSAWLWAAEQLDLIGITDRACAQQPPTDGPSISEMVLAITIQRACAPGAKCRLAALGILPAACLVLAGGGVHRRSFHRLASGVTDEHLDKAQIGIARVAVERFGLCADVLAFDTPKFDTILRPLHREIWRGVATP